MPITSDFETERTQILEALVNQDPFLGWTEANIRNVCQDFGFDQRTMIRVFPSGVRDLILAHGAAIDSAMLTSASPLALLDMPVRKRISTLVMLRIQAMSSHREAVSRLIPLLYSPQYLSIGAETLYRSIDLMWRTAGDTATDFNYYSKRSLLSAVYCSTVLYWLTDNSSDYLETQAFLERRIANVMSIQKIKPKIKNYFPEIETSILSLFKALKSLRRAH